MHMLYEAINYQRTDNLMVIYIERPAIQKLWQLPEGMKGRVSVLGKPGIQRGKLRLVEFSP